MQKKLGERNKTLCKKLRKNLRRLQSVKELHPEHITKQVKTFRWTSEQLSTTDGNQRLVISTSHGDNDAYRRGHQPVYRARSCVPGSSGRSKIYIKNMRPLVGGLASPR